MTGLIMAAQLIMGLSILVSLHEIGHFLAARAFGIKVEKFYLFFDAWGFKLFSFQKGDTEYGIGWIPLGGYVKIAGMIDESLDTAQLASEPQPWEYRAKPAWQRLIVMISGVVMNLLLGVVIYSATLLNYKHEYLPNAEVVKGEGIYAFKLGRELGLQNGDKILTINGKSFERFEDILSSRVVFGATLKVLRNGQELEIVIPDNFYRTLNTAGRTNFIGAGNIYYEVSQVDPGQPADKAGFKVGDKINAINGKVISDADDMKNLIMLSKGKQATLTVVRGDSTLNITTTITEKGTIGIGYGAFCMQNKHYKMKQYTFLSALSFGSSDAFEALISNAKGLRKIFTGEEKATDSVQGPIGIAQIYGGQWNWPWFWSITGLLSMVLAFMNILPIPALDGGHVFFLGIEAITRRKLSDKFMERAQIVGMVILLGLMVFAVGNDVWKHVLN